MKKNVHSHLTREKRILLGSYYTPHYFVMLAGEWMRRHGITSYTVLDTSSGTGSFFSLESEFHDSKFIGNDIDANAINLLESNFPSVKVFNLNALHNISRSCFGVTETEKLIIVGNPPYNDVTSQIQKALKTSTKLDKLDVDESVRTRDLGLSFLKSYDILKADYALILHPLSYLIKKTNFNSAKSFFSNYTMEEHIVFSSDEFSNTSKLASFPIIMSLYKRCVGRGLTYEKVLSMKFKTKEGETFCISERDYIGSVIKKYPNKERYTPDLKFYTLRDLNALRRSRTFLKEDIQNAIHIDPAFLSYYCYVDCVKEYLEHFRVPYFMGNFDIPFFRDTFDAIKDDVVSVSEWRHRDIFPRAVKPSDISLSNIERYIGEVMSWGRE